jgi:hypothetical protein
LRLVPDQVLRPTRDCTDGVGVDDRWEVVAPKSPAEVPPASAARGGVSTLVAATGSEVVLLSTAPRGGVAVRASSASVFPTTCGSGDLVREGEGGEPRPPCGLVTGLHGKEKNLQYTK